MHLQLTVTFLAMEAYLATLATDVFPHWGQTKVAVLLLVIKTFWVIIAFSRYARFDGFLKPPCR
jgi:hypothetical protein